MFGISSSLTLSSIRPSSCQRFPAQPTCQHSKLEWTGTTPTLINSRRRTMLAGTRNSIISSILTTDKKIEIMTSVSKLITQRLAKQKTDGSQSGPSLARSSTELRAAMARNLARTFWTKTNLIGWSRRHGTLTNSMQYSIGHRSCKSYLIEQTYLLSKRNSQLPTLLQGKKRYELIILATRSATLNTQQLAGKSSPKETVSTLIL